MYYTKNAKDTHPELMENALGCYSKQTATIQKETFQSIIKDSLNVDEKKADKIFMEVQEGLNNMLEEHNAIYEDVDVDLEPIVLTKTDIQNILIESGVPEEVTTKIEKTYVETFGDDLPLAENLIDSKVLKVSEQVKREEYLQKQVEVLQSRLEEVKQEVAIANESSTNSDDLVSENETDNTLENEESIDLEENNSYDVILEVKPEKIPQIKSQIIDGQKCIVIPINENEQAKVNGKEDVI